MGHKTIAMTLRYSHLSPTHLRDAVEGLCGGMRENLIGTKIGTEEIVEQGFEAWPSLTHQYLR